MIDVRLTYNTIRKWFTQDNISVIGYAFRKDTLLIENTLASFFQPVQNETSFIEKLNQLSGHFAVVLQLENFVLFAVDTIRTFPLFIKHARQDIIVSDLIDASNCRWNEQELDAFKNVYCTLDNKTLLKEWKQLQAGEYAVVDKISNTITISSYYLHKSEQKNNNETQLKELETILISNIKTVATGKTILIPLSGGYDSRYLLALLKDNQINNIECFTYGRKESYEVLIAKNVCEKLNIKWHFIEYSDELLKTFFTETWNQYAALNHHFSSLPHEQDFFALYYLREKKLLPENAIIMNGFCQDIHAGSFIEPVRNFDVANFISYKHQLDINTGNLENSWNGYQQWLVKNRLSKFIINSVRVYEYFGLDFYLPFWQTDWINFWYNLPLEKRLNQQFYNDYLFNGIFKQYKIDFKKPVHDSTNKWYTLKRIGKKILPNSITKLLQLQNSQSTQKDSNNTLFLYDSIYNVLKEKPAEKDFRINNIHALYLLQNLKENYHL